MKTIKFIPLFCTIILLFTNQKIKANQFIDPNAPGLEISSTLTLDGEKISDYTLIIYDETQSSDTLNISRSKVIYLKLNYGHTYSLRYLKQGFHERVVMIDTRIDEEKQKDETGFDFEIEMIPAGQQGNTLSDLPVAVVHYDYSEKKFEYSRDYHRQVRGKEIAERDFD